MQNKNQISKIKSQKLHNILLEIVERKKQNLIEQMQKVSVQELKERIKAIDSKNIFKENIYDAKDVALIAEIKFASPTNPNLGSQRELLERVKKYEKAGANAISIITEPHFFKGDIAFVSQVKKTVKLPVLQKDFVIDAYQIYEAKNIGSDALLLIARLLDKDALKSFVRICNDLEIEPVVEINNEEDLEKAIATKTKIIAVNARDLETFHVDVTRACELIKKIPNKFIKLGFSGISSPVEVKQYRNAGAKGVLVGTSLMTTKDTHGFLADLRGDKISENQSIISENQDTVKVKICGIRTIENAKSAIVTGADFLGFNFVPTSKRRVSVEKAEKIINELRGTNPFGKLRTSHELRTRFVGVFQNQSLETVNEIAKLLDLDFVQLHGEEDEDYMKKIKTKIIKKYNLQSFTDLNEYSEYVLLDREVQGKGKMVNLEKAAKIATIFPVFFSGGLTPDNVSDVVKKVKPFGIDVAGGIETDGEIDNDKMKAFITNAKGVAL